MLNAKAAPAGSIPKFLNAANTTSSSTPIAPPCRLKANTRLLSRLRQANTSAASAAAATPASFNSAGIANQPWSAPYFSSEATPASNTSMPIFTGTLPTVNQRCTARIAMVAMPGAAGFAGCGRGIGRGTGAMVTAGAGAIGSFARGAAGAAAGTTGGTGASCTDGGGACAVGCDVGGAD